MEGDGLATVLRSLRLESAFLSRSHFRGRWGVIGSSSAGKMIFHGIAAGDCYVRREAGGQDWRLAAGDVVIFTRGEEHRMTSASDADVVRVTQVPVRRVGEMPLFELGAAGTETRLVCGTFRLDHPAHASVVELLPPVLVGKPRTDAQRRWASATVALIEEELGGGAPTPHTTSLADSLFVSALHSAAAESAPRASGLLAAARDERIGRALALIHTDPRTSWTVERLASQAAMSRTRFFERFTSLVGEPPAKYIARWRTLVAADLLRGKSLSTAEVAERVGYADEDSLSKVFKRYLGMSPTEYRRAEPA